MDADPPPKPDSTADGRCRGCDSRDRRIAELERRLAEVEKLLDASRRGGKRQAAPFSKGPPKADPKPPGRKGGDDYGTKAFRAVPPAVDETHEAPLPQKCPHCGDEAVVETQVDAQY